MNARILSFFLLLIFIGGPLVFYIYFTKKEVSSLTISPTIGSEYSVDLQGTLSYRFLPLADKFLKFHQECISTCVISPLPPLNYTLTITSTGNIDFQKQITIPPGKNENILYEVQKDFQAREIIESLPGDELVGYKYLAQLSPEKRIVSTSLDGRTTLGILQGTNYMPLREIGGDIINITSDISGQFILLEKSKSTTLLSKDFRDEREFSHEYGIPKIVSHFGTNWKIKTTLGVWENQGDSWEQNIRFTDFIDLSPYKRIGYIASDDTTRLSLGNFPRGSGVLIYLDRKNGKSTILKKGIDIEGFFYIEGKPAYQDTEGKKYIIDTDI